MYDAVITIMDIAAYILWGWCLYRFCGSFLILRRSGSRRGTAPGEPVLPESRGSFLKNGWPIWCFWSVWKWLHGLLPGIDYDTVHSLFRAILLYGALFLFLCVFYEGGRGALIYCFVTFTAVSEISRFLAQAASPLGYGLFEVAGRMLEEGLITDLEVYLNLMTLFSCAAQIFMNVIFILCLRVTLYCTGRIFRGRSKAFDRVELRFLLLPGCIASMCCVLLRIIMVTMEEGQMPMLMYDRYPLLTGVVPLLLILCLCSVLYSARLLCELRDLHEEKNRSAVLGQQLESMEEHLRETERVYAGVRAMKHDMKNQLAVMTELAGHSGAEAELQAYLAQMNRTLSELDFPYRTGSAVLDTLVGIKFHEMREKVPGISFQADHLLIPPNLQVSPMDLSLILGNGLDNAIEACERLAGTGGLCGERTCEAEPGIGGRTDAEPERPWIRVGTMMRGSCFLLEIVNSFDGRLNVPVGREFPETNKEERSLHGIGLSSIKATARKYHGGVDWRTEGKVFTLTVMLKGEEACRGL